MDPPTPAIKRIVKFVPKRRKKAVYKLLPKVFGLQVSPYSAGPAGTAFARRRISFFNEPQDLKREFHSLMVHSFEVFRI